MSEGRGAEGGGKGGRGRAEKGEREGEVGGDKERKDAKEKISGGNGEGRGGGESSWGRACAFGAVGKSRTAVGKAG